MPDDVKVISNGAKFLLGIRSEHSSATLTILNADDEPILFVDMHGGALRAVANMFKEGADRLERLAPGQLVN